MPGEDAGALGEIMSAVGEPVPLGSLLEGLPIEPHSALGADAGMPVSGVEFDSRKVADGDLFVAWPGERFDGRRFAEQAVESGAVAVLAADGPLAPIAAPWLITADPRRMLGPLASKIYGSADRDLTTVGVTGTNGKTTTMLLVAAILQRAGLPCGTLGTLGYSFAQHHFGGQRTTPEASDLLRLLATMKELGAEAASFEVSSHALDQGRVDEIRLDVGVFTNLTRDHFDYHGGFEEYYQAKRRMFGLLKDDGVAIVWRDDEWGQRLLREVTAPELAGSRRVISYGESDPGALAGPAGEAVELLEAALDRDGLRATFNTRRGSLTVRSPLLGRYNLWNVMGALAVAEALDLPHEAVQDALAEQQAVPGRLQRVEAGQEFLVLVDYAHTDGALEATLRSMRSLWPGKLMVVFGCGGNRDQGKRPLMGRAAAELSDLAILTDDNPRDEDPEAIHAEVLTGIEQAKRSAAPGAAINVEVIPDRAAAIEAAIDRAFAEDGWAVVVAGKGHESGQTVGDEVRPFNDAEEIEQVLRSRLADRSVPSAVEPNQMQGARNGADDHA